MMFSHRRFAFRAMAVALALLAAAPANAQVGGPPAPPVTFWQFFGIPQGIKKLQGATRNRRGNFPGLEPRPPMRAIADPRNLESPDPSIKKAAEVKMAEDLKAQKIKAIKYLASIGCGCYDVDGGVTAALVASLQDCTEDVRYETIQALVEAAENGACARCGEGCCCNKEILLTLAKLAYERKDDGCYVEPSERVREAAAEALETCCPNDSPPVIVPAEPPPTPERREAGEAIEAEESRESGPLPTPPPPPVPLPEPSVRNLLDGDILSQLAPQGPEQVVLPSGVPCTAQRYGYGVVLHVSPQHGLAHIHFKESGLTAEVGTELGVYASQGDRRELLAKLQVVQSFPGSANVRGDMEALANIARGDLVLCPPTKFAMQSRDAISATWVSSEEPVEPQAASHAEAAVMPEAPSPESAPLTSATSVESSLPQATAAPVEAPRAPRRDPGAAFRKGYRAPRAQASGFVR